MIAQELGRNTYPYWEQAGEVRLMHISPEEIVSYETGMARNLDLARKLRALGWKHGQIADALGVKRPAVTNGLTRAERKTADPDTGLPWKLTERAKASYYGRNCRRHLKVQSGWKLRKPEQAEYDEFLERLADNTIDKYPMGRVVYFNESTGCFGFRPRTPLDFPEPFVPFPVS